MIAANTLAPSKTVLLVDDDLSTVNLYSKGLRQAGFRTVSAFDAHPPVEQLPNLSADLIILDWMGPKRGGLELLQAIRSGSQHQMTPVLVLFNGYLPDLAQTALKAGGDRAVPKSEFTSSKLISVSRELVGLGSTGIESSATAEPAATDLVDQLQRELEEQGSVEIATIRQLCLRYLDLAGSPEGKQHLASVYQGIRLLHTRAALAGCARIAQLSGAIEAMLFGGVSRSEVPMSESSVQTLVQGIECLEQLFTRGSTRSATPPGKRRVLVVDDDQVSNEANKAALARVNYEAVCATDGIAALIELNKNPFDLILLDINMPGMNGIQLCQKLRGLPHHKATPVIFVTVSSDFHSRAQSLLSGGDDVISKPIAPLELVVKATVFLLDESRSQSPKEPPRLEILPTAPGPAVTLPEGAVPLPSSPAEHSAPEHLAWEQNGWPLGVSERLRYLTEALAQETRRREEVEQQSAENANRRQQLETAIEENQRSHQRFRELLEACQLGALDSGPRTETEHLRHAGRRRALLEVSDFVADKLVGLKQALEEEKKRGEAVERAIAENAKRRTRIEAVLAEIQRVQAAFEVELESTANLKQLLELESALAESQRARQRLEGELGAVQLELEALGSDQGARASELEAQRQELLSAHAQAEQQVMERKQALAAEIERREAIKRQAAEHALCRGELEAALAQNVQTGVALQREMEASASAKRRAELEAELVESRQAQSRLHQELEEAEKQMGSLRAKSSTAQALEVEAAELKTAQAEMKRQLQRLAAALAEETRRREGAEQQGGLLAQQRSAIETELEQLDQQFQQAQEELELKTPAAEPLKMATRAEQVQAARLRLEQQVQRLTKALAGNTRPPEGVAPFPGQNESGQQPEVQLEQFEQELAAQEEQVRAQLETSNAEQSRLQARIDQLQAEHAQLQTGDGVRLRGELEARLSQLSQHLGQARSQLQSEEQLQQLLQHAQEQFLRLRQLPGALRQRRRVEQFRRKYQTSLVTLVFTDLVDSVALRRQLGDQAAATLLLTHRQMVRELLQRGFEAEEIDTAGDSFLLLFARPSDAAEFALLLQRGTSTLAQDQKVELAVRIGIHVGEVVVEECTEGPKPKDVQGSQTDLCARVMGMAEGGQILLTRAVFDSARQALKGEKLHGWNALQWLDHGPYVLKGIEEPVVIYEVGEVGVGVLKAPADSEKARRKPQAGDEAVLGWRPAVGQPVPHTRWVLERKLGEGGGSEVWLGRHQTMKAQRVFKFFFRAERVRFLKQELNLFRLLTERVGDHPNIVRLHDVYLEEPPYYFEMDYVDAPDLCTWCQQQGGVASLSLEQRLEIVAQIADGLQAAHDVGALHRDVRPDNIRIALPSPLPNCQSPLSPTPTEAQPGQSHREPTASKSGFQAKLADFGIARAVSEESRGGVPGAGLAPVRTSDPSSAPSGTQPYLAPELFAGQPASTRSDIYSLGVVLYQMVTRDFTRPVTNDWAAQVLDPLLREDLKRCLADNPQDRFPAAAQLAQNLRHFAQRHHRLAQQEREFASRERVAYRRGIVRTTSVAAVIVALSGAVTVFGVRQARVAEENAGLAREQTAKSALEAAFLKDMLKSVSPSIARGRDTQLLQDVLTNAVHRLDTEFADQPEIEADLRLILSRAYREIGDASSAVAMARRAVQLRRAVPAPTHAGLADALEQLAAALSSQGDTVEAESPQRQALAIREKTRGRQDLVFADSLSALGLLLEHNGEPRQAAQAYGEALAIQEKSLPRPNESLANLLLKLSRVQCEVGDFEAGEKRAREALGQFLQLFGENHSATANALSAQARALNQLGRIAEAELTIRKAMAVYAALYKEDHGSQADALDDLGLILQKKGDLEGAEAAFRDALGMAETLHGESHPDSLKTMRHLALALSLSAPALPEAEALIDRAITVARQGFPREPGILARCLIDDSSLLVNSGQLQEAKSALLEAYSLVAGTAASNEQRDICEALEHLYERLGQPRQAEKWGSRLAALDKR